MNKCHGRVEHIKRFVKHTRIQKLTQYNFDKDKLNGMKILISWTHVNCWIHTINKN